MNNLGRQIREARMEKRLTQAQLAEAIGVNNLAICRWENGDGTPSIKSQRALRKFFPDLKVPTEELAGGASTIDPAEWWEEKERLERDLLRAESLQRKADHKIIVLERALMNAIGFLHHVEDDGYSRHRLILILEAALARSPE